MTHSCPARSGYDWYLECFRFHKKNLWFSLALFLFAASPGFLFNMIPVLGPILGAAVSIFAQSGYLISVDRLKKGEVFKPDFLWMGFSDPATRKALIPWVLISGGVSLVFTFALAPVALLQSHLGDANLESIIPVVFGFLFGIFIYASIQILIFFWIAPIATFKKLPFRETLRLGLEGMAVNVNSLLVNSAVGVGFMLFLLGLGALDALPLIMASRGTGMMIIAGLISGFGGLLYLLFLFIAVLPAFALMPYFIYQSIYEN